MNIAVTWRLSPLMLHMVMMMLLILLMDVPPPSGNVDSERLMVFVHCLLLLCRHIDIMFHTTCTINDKLCLLAIDNSSEHNLFLQRLIDKLQLRVQPHPRLYPARWVDDDCFKLVAL